MNPSVVLIRDGARFAGNASPMQIVARQYKQPSGPGALLAPVETYNGRAIEGELQTRGEVFQSRAVASDRLVFASYTVLGIYSKTIQRLYALKMCMLSHGNRPRMSSSATTARSSPWTTQ